MLGNGKFKKTVASTLSEIRGLLPLAEEGILEEVRESSIGVTWKPRNLNALLC